MLGFGHPALLWGLAAVGIPVAVHFLSRRQSRKQAFAAVALLRQARREHTPRVRLRDLLLMAVRLALVALVALAITRPSWRASADVVAPQGREAVALVVDASASMRYRLGGRSLWERGRSAAREVIERLPADSPASVLVCDGRSPTPVPAGFDRAALLRVLSESEVTWRAVDLAPCLAAAAQSLTDVTADRWTVQVFSDLTTTSIAPGTAAPRIRTPQGEKTPSVVWVDAAEGSALPNVGVVGIEVAPTADVGPRGYTITAQVRNASDSPLSGAPIALEVDGEVVTRGFVDATAGGTAQKVLTHRFDPGVHTVRVRLDSDAFADDDAREALVEVPRDARVWVIDGAPAAERREDEAYFVEIALGAAQTGGRIAATVLDPEAATRRPPDDVDAVLLLNVAAPRPELVSVVRTVVERGGGVLIAMGDQVDPDRYNAVMSDLLPRPLHLARSNGAGDGQVTGFGRIDLSHPVMKAFDGTTEGFESIRIERQMLFAADAAAGEKMLAATDDGSPLLVEAPHGAGRVLLYGSTVDRDWTDWPIRPSFLPFWQQLTLYLAGASDDRPHTAWTVGEAGVVPLAESDRLARVEGPDHKEVPLGEAQGNSARIVPDRPGVHAVDITTGAGTTLRRAEAAFAVVLDPRESDTTRWDSAASRAVLSGAGEVRVASGAQDALQSDGLPLWGYALLLLVFVFLTEGWMVRRA